MQVERRALYNSLRMNWLYDPSIKVESWQVEDYRALSLEELFDRLEKKGFFLDRVSFLAMAENVDAPEDLTDDLLADTDLNVTEQDQVYLLLFELWRRFVPEKPCLSVFCDELDYQVHLYDQGKASRIEVMQDILANLKVVLDENTDQVGDPTEVFQSISASCANDIESFLYDFIAEQVDSQNASYASELLDNFIDYMKDVRWFDFLRVRLIALKDTPGANVLIHHLVSEGDADEDLEFNLEILAFMVHGGERDDFVSLVKKTVGLLELEEDFQDLLVICADYYSLLDHEDEEAAIRKMIKSRSHNNLENIMRQSDPDISELLKILT